MDYGTLRTLKHIKKDNEKTFNMFFDLESKIHNDSNNILIICRNKRACKEAIKFIAKDYIEKCKVNMSSLTLTIDGINIMFVSITDLEEKIIGRKFKDYHFEEEFHI